MNNDDGSNGRGCGRRPLRGNGGRPGQGTPRTRRSSRIAESQGDQAQQGWLPEAAAAAGPGVTAGNDPNDSPLVAGGDGNGIGTTVTFSSYAETSMAPSDPTDSSFSTSGSSPTATQLVFLAASAPGQVTENATAPTAMMAPPVGPEAQEEAPDHAPAAAAPSEGSDTAAEPMLAVAESSVTSPAGAEQLERREPPAQPRARRGPPKLPQPSVRRREVSEAMTVTIPSREALLSSPPLPAVAGCGGDDRLAWSVRNHPPVGRFADLTPGFTYQPIPEGSLAPPRPPEGPARDASRRERRRARRANAAPVPERPSVPPAPQFRSFKDPGYPIEGNWENLFQGQRPTSWKCRICLTGNTENSAKCESCEAPNPNAPQQQDQPPAQDQVPAPAQPPAREIPVPPQQEQGQPPAQEPGQPPAQAPPPEIPVQHQREQGQPPAQEHDQQRQRPAQQAAAPAPAASSSGASLSATFFVAPTGQTATLPAVAPQDPPTFNFASFAASAPPPAATVAAVAQQDPLKFNFSPFAPPDDPAPSQPAGFIYRPPGAAPPIPAPVAQLQLATNAATATAAAGGENGSEEDRNPSPTEVWTADATPPADGVATAAPSAEADVSGYGNAETFDNIIVRYIIKDEFGEGTGISRRLTEVPGRLLIEKKNDGGAAGVSGSYWYRMLMRDLKDENKVLMNIRLEPGTTRLMFYPRTRNRRIPRLEVFASNDGPDGPAPGDRAWTVHSGEGQDSLPRLIDFLKSSTFFVPDKEE